MDNGIKVIEDLKEVEKNKTQADLCNHLGLFDIYEEYAKGNGVKILVVDTGIKCDHSEFSNKEIYMRNRLQMNKDATDLSGHGTLISSIISGNDIGLVPEAELGVVKSLDMNGNGTQLSVIDALSIAINQKYDVVCMSLGSYNIPPMILRNKFNDARARGITICSAVGNDSSPETMYPAKLDSVISVGGVDFNNEITKFSNYHYDVSAPSVDIFGAYNNSNNSYAKMTGTSAAVPIVASIVGLMKSYSRNIGVKLSETLIKELLVTAKVLNKDSVYNIFEEIKKIKK